MEAPSNIGASFSLLLGMGRYKEVRHGTRNEYNRHGCHCDVCRAGNAAYRKAQKLRYKALGKHESKDRHRSKVYDIIKKSHCVICGEYDPVVLDFDHIDPATKTATVSELMHRGKSWKRIQEEIAKCQVLCSNCHRRKTATEGGWTRSN